MAKKLLYLTLTFLTILACCLSVNAGTAEAKKEKSKQKVTPGIEVFLEDHLDWVKGKKVGLITNPTGVNSDLESSVDLLFDHPEVNLTSLFGPEHGIRGDQPAGEYVESYNDERTGLPVYSLYGPTWKPTEEMLEDVDVLVFDIQDVGSNVYTYIYTLGFAMEAAAEFDKELIVLDRPNPTGGVRVEGPLRDEETVSFMGRFLLPVRHGMTVGELATMWNHEYSLGVNLKVSKMKGWKRSMFYEETELPYVQTSPNIPTVDTAFLYTGTELVDDTSLSTGLGTTKPFELLGAPWINGQQLANDLNQRDLDGVAFRAAYFTPMFGAYKGERVGGVQVHIKDREEIDLVELGLHLVDAMKDQNPDKFKIFPAYDSLMGDTRVRPMLLEDKPVDEIMALWEDELESWVEGTRNHYLLYGPYPKKAKPYKPSTILGILPHDLELAPQQSQEVEVIGFDKKGERIEIDPTQVEWSVNPKIGLIKNGIFTANKSGAGTITASYKDSKASRSFEISSNLVNNIRFGVNKEYTRIVFDLNKNAKYEIERSGDKMIVTIPFSEIGEPLSERGDHSIIIPDSPLISKIDYELTEDQTFQAQFYLKESDIEYQTPSFSNRIVIDLMSQ